MKHDFFQLAKICFAKIYPIKVVRKTRSLLHYLYFYFCVGSDEMGFLIPEITRLPNLQGYLDGTSNFKYLRKKKNDDMNAKLLRFFEDPSLCFYRNKQFEGYQ